MISVVLLALSQAVTWGLGILTPGNPLTIHDQIFVTIYLLLAGLVVEVVRWARESVEHAGKQVSKILDDRLADSAERAIRTAVLRSIFPNSDPDTVNARIHFDIVGGYLRRVERWPPLIQRVSGVMVSRHLALWDSDMDALTGRDGLSLKMDESARMTAVMVEGCTKYLTIERVPCDPQSSWSPGFLRVIEEMAARTSLQKTFILLANPAALWGPDLPAPVRKETKELFVTQVEFLHSKGFSVQFCDERVLHKELGTTDIPQYNLEVFSEQVALMMDSAETYDRTLITRVRSLADTSHIRRFLYIVEQHAKSVTPRIVRSEQLG